MELLVVLALVAALGLTLIGVALLLLRLPAIPVLAAGGRVERLGRRLLRAPGRAARGIATFARQSAGRARAATSHGLEVAETALGLETGELRRRLRVDAGLRTVGRVGGRIKRVGVDAPVAFVRRLGPRERRDPFQRWALRLLVVGVVLLVIAVGGLVAAVVLPGPLPLGATG
ncbi:hypothetical protein [Haloparvum sp. PAK95]|uniref:hypothetical protein n=1 Tax=Haloparvum sp. PAK95 TaxID=3418962 RepID=UPI003D2F4470